MTTREHDLAELSRRKWELMSAKDVAALTEIFHEQGAFVHMGATMTTEQELAVIESGGIHYATAVVEGVEVRVVDEVALVLSTVVLTAVVGGNEVTNPFSVTETWVAQDESWKLLAMAFTRLVNHPAS
ncbi:nuclear transport factor 2 family protein [Aestuariimicrobium ganziense]|uniref:nuclear transport factor 2 family protein n=1 Tax=Aestuariimicrobium ganziense TaxID=2773677 RepID=UPI00194287C4|nr:nuclear transport factor 2 family protein [Aestuariimicrobium ganziense]